METEKVITVEKNSLSSPQVLHCEKLLRDLPRKRQVFQGKWQEKEVIIKLFFHKHHARRHTRREWKGLLSLAKLSQNSPAPLFWGKLNSKTYTLVMEKIPAAQSGWEIWQSLEEKTSRENFLKKIIKQLAQQHQQGILQQDLHLDNFLLQEDSIYLIDPSQMQFFGKHLSRKTSIKQLASLLSQLDLPSSFREPLLTVYTQARSWEVRPSDKAYLEKKIHSYRSARIKKTLHKYLRTNRLHQKIIKQGHILVIEKSFSKQAHSLLENIDQWMEEGEVLKRGNTCFVSKVMLGETPVVIKRYNHKGFWHSFRHSIKRSRARRCWLFAHRLLLSQIATARPLAFMEKRWGKYIECSYFISEYVQGEDLQPFLSSPNKEEKLRRRVAHETKQLIEKLHLELISHGDLKHQNILLRDGKPILIDLDGMEVHRKKKKFLSRQKKDIKRFAKNWQDQPEVSALFDEPYDTN